jgi:hypothetical protein
MKKQHLITIASALIFGAAMIGCATRSPSFSERLRNILVSGTQVKSEQVQIHQTRAGFTDVTVSGVTNQEDKQLIEDIIGRWNTSEMKTDSYRLKFE